MNSYSVDLTRTGRSPQPNIPEFDGRLDFDQQFERKLPPEILAELEGESPPQTYRLREIPNYLRPAPPSVRRSERTTARPPMVLRAPSPAVLPSPPFVAPPPPPVMPPVPRQAQSAPRRGSGIWWLLLAALLGLPILFGSLPHASSTFR